MTSKRSVPEFQGLTLRVGDHRYRFNTPAEFEFALEGRSCVPSAKIATLMDAPDESLLREAANIHKAKRRLAAMLSEVLVDESRINDLLKRIDLTLISNDNNWRTIISMLIDVPASKEQYKKIALLHYMQYLVCRREIVTALQLKRRTKDKPPVGQDDAAEGDPGLKETVMLEYATFRNTYGEDVEYRRLPKGQTVELWLKPAEVFTVFIARHECAIVMRDRLFFIDADGRETSLQSGRHIVGRDPAADIVMQAKLRDISRKHLVIETEGAELVRVTDISSRGTWVHPRHLDASGV